MRKYGRAVVSLMFIPIFGSWLADELRDGLYYAWGWREPPPGWAWWTVPAADAGLLPRYAAFPHLRPDRDRLLLRMGLTIDLVPCPPAPGPAVPPPAQA